MRKAVRLSTMTGTHKPLVTGSNPVAATYSNLTMPFRLLVS